jgi:NAD+ synthase (glutamine-hydrolysing)
MTLRIAIGQINSTVGDLNGNAGKIVSYIRRAQEFGADIVVFPELALTGYPPEDLLLKPKFVADNLETIKHVASAAEDIVAIVGFVDKKGKDLYNAAAVIYKGEIKGVFHKMILPNYGPFDEKRYFAPGKEARVFQYGKVLFGGNICEDIWHPNTGPTCAQSQAGAKLILNINASPYYSGRISERQRIIKKQAKDNKVSIVYVNMVGGQDELLFDGQSMVVNQNGRIIGKAMPFREDLQILDVEAPEYKGKQLKNVIVVERNTVEKNRVPLLKQNVRFMDPVAEVYQALVLGLKDYVGKNGFQKVVLGMSGGIDSALVATLAVDALGKENVVGVFMPSQYSSKASETDARQTANNLGIKYMTLPIKQLYQAYLVMLEPVFEGLARNIAEENLQARIRGNILMAFSNKFGWLVLATGNKSEMSTGYATLYGDMAGGFAVIKDVPKTLVYKLAKYRNKRGKVIPGNVLTKAPTAELKPNQKDSDTLPEYKTLDPILKAYIEDDKELQKIVKQGFDAEVVDRVISMVDRSEYKRRQSPPGIKITPKSFGKDRRLPITNKYKG